MFFFFPFGFGGGGGFLIFLIMFWLLRRVFRFLGNKDNSYQGFANSYSPAPINKDFFVGMFSMLAKLASADGQVQESVKRRIHIFMVNDLHLDSASFQYATNIFNSALNDNVSFETLVDSFYAKFATSPSLLRMTLDIFYSIAVTDGHFSRREDEMLSYAARAFHIPEGIVDSIKRKYGVDKSSPSKAYAILGVGENATDDEIKKAYRKLILEYHPDRVTANGAGEEFKEFATKRFREVQEAYEQIKKERGIK